MAVMPPWSAVSTSVRDWVASVVQPITGHLATLETPSWYARFAAQLMTDPVLRDLIVDDAVGSPAFRHVHATSSRHLPDLPAGVRAERNDMVRILVTHTCAERERALADGAGTGWDDTAAALIDAITGLLLAP